MPGRLSRPTRVGLRPCRAPWRRRSRPWAGPSTAVNNTGGGQRRKDAHGAPEQELRLRQRCDQPGDSQADLARPATSWTMRRSLLLPLRGPLRRRQGAGRGGWRRVGVDRLIPSPLSLFIFIFIFNSRTMLLNREKPPRHPARDQNDFQPRPRTGATAGGTRWRCSSPRARGKRLRLGVGEFSLHGEVDRGQDGEATAGRTRLRDRERRFRGDVDTR